MWTCDLAKAMEKIQKHYGMLCCVDRIENNRIIMSGGDVWVVKDRDVQLVNESASVKTYELEVGLVGKLIVKAHSAEEAKLYYRKLDWEDLIKELVDIDDCLRDVCAID